MKFLSSINVNDAYVLPLVDGAVGQALLTDGSGNAYWGTISTALSLNELTDVTISSPVTAQLLRYNGSQWVNWTPNFLTAESDTLATVVARGASTVNTITVGGLNVNGNTTITGTLTVPKIEKNGSQIINSIEQSEFEGQVLKILSIQWVSTEIAKVESNGKITAGSFVKYGGTSSQFLKADGSVDSNTYLTSYSETDTLDSVTDRGNTTTNTIAVGGLTSSGLVYTNDIWSTQDAIRFMADEGVNIQPAQGESEVVFYFDWAEANIASIDTDGKFIGSGFKTSAGLSTQFLKADGSVDSSTYATQTWVGQNYATVDYVDDEISGVNTYVSTYYVPKTRTITINGTAYDLSADRSWTISTADGYISNVSLAGNLLSFTGVGSGFNGSVDLSGISVNLNEVETVYERVKNVSGALIQKGTPLAVVEGQTSGFASDVVPADASDPTKMPALFIANEDIDPEAEGEAVVFGAFSGVDTSLYPSGTVVYVAAGGGWTDTKPVWPNKIQNLGVITKSHESNGGGIVTGVGRANDIPNLTAGKIWVGTANYPIESTTVHIDEANTRMGVGTSSIEGGLHINYSAANTLLMQRISPDSGPPEAIGRKARGTVSAKTGVLSGDRLWFFAAAGYYGTEGIDGAWSANKVGMNFVASETWTPSAQGTHITWATTAAGQTTRTDKMILTGTGDLGIGTNTPAEKLHVVGNIRIDGNSTAAILETGDKTAGEGGVVFESYDVATTYGAFVDYVIYDTTRDNMRAGTFYAVWNTGEAVYTDTSTVDIGDTSNAVLYAEIDGTNVNLIVNGSTSFTIKYNLKLIK